LSLQLCANAQYLLKLPSDPGIVLPGLWLLFVMDAAGVPSVAADLKIKTLATPSPPAAPVPASVGAALQPAVSAGG
jgi:hypothetical protein